MEGPSLYLAKQLLQPFKKKKVLKVEGNTQQMDKVIFLNREVKDIFSWGKHLVFQFDTIALRVHFMMFGTFEADVNGVSVTGDYKRAREPRLAFTFDNGDIKMFSCSLKLHETKNLKKTYDFTVDVMSKKWDGKQAMLNVLKYPEEEIGDVLLDQTIFSGVGNIIRLETLFLQKVSPRRKVKDIEPKRLSGIVKEAHDFSWQFYEWRKIFKLKANLKIYRKWVCPVCGSKTVRGKMGKRERSTVYCPVCQL